MVIPVKRARILIAAVLLIAGSLGATEQPGSTASPGYLVSLELTVDETGAVEKATVVASDNEMLATLATGLALKRKLPLRMEQGVPVKYTILAPMAFAVEGDGGAEAQKGPMPKLIVGKTFVSPRVPSELRNEKRGGGAILQLRIATTGSVEELKVVRASHQAWAKAVERAVKQWRFKPAMVEGRPVEVLRFMAFIFEPNEAMADLQWYLAPRPCLDEFIVTGRVVRRH